MIASPFKEVETFEWKDLHKKKGIILHHTPTESDIAEGNFMEMMVFVDHDFCQYLIWERDVRGPRWDRDE